eukprot:m51a1_g11186 hypothetical protein (224) ;mRNA; r:8073-17412
MNPKGEVFLVHTWPPINETANIRILSYPEAIAYPQVANWEEKRIVARQSMATEDQQPSGFWSNVHAGIKGWHSRYRVQTLGSNAEPLMQSPESLFGDLYNGSETKGVDGTLWCLVLCQKNGTLTTGFGGHLHLHKSESAPQAATRELREESYGVLEGLAELLQERIQWIHNSNFGRIKGLSHEQFLQQSRLLGHGVNWHRNIRADLWGDPNCIAYENFMLNGP